MHIVVHMLQWIIFLVWLPSGFSYFGPSIKSHAKGLQVPPSRFFNGASSGVTALHMSSSGGVGAGTNLFIVGDTSSEFLLRIVSNNLFDSAGAAAASLADAVAAHRRGESVYIDVGASLQDNEELLMYLRNNIDSFFFLGDDFEKFNSGAVEDVRKACKYTVYLPSSDTSLHYTDASAAYATEKRFLRLVDRVSGQQSTGKKYVPPAAGTSDVVDVSDDESAAAARQQLLLDAGEWSHFLSLTFPTIDEALPLLPELRIGSDALELRVDLLKDYSPTSLHRQIALLRDYTNCSLPIVFTVRTKEQIGKFPGDAIDAIQNLLEEGLRAGAEWIDVEGCLPEPVIRSIATLRNHKYAPTSRLLGSLHITTPPKDAAEVEAMYAACDLFGFADMLKVVTGAHSRDDCELVHRVGAAQQKPYIGLCLGEAGAYSRVINRRFTPVTHELMAAAAPGQLTVKQLMAEREKQGLVTKKQYFLFGTPIQQSLSPAMHNNAYRALCLPHHYGLNEQSDVNAYQSVVADASFGGASVTIPHKETIAAFLTEVSGAAQTIGAVNTIAVEYEVQQGDDEVSAASTAVAIEAAATAAAVARRKLVGYNTDWIGIQRPIKRQLARQGRLQCLSKKRIGLVIGAGEHHHAQSHPPSLSMLWSHMIVIVLNAS